LSAKAWELNAPTATHDKQATTKGTDMAAAPAIRISPGYRLTGDN
jgi:hypothetical protein